MPVVHVPDVPRVPAERFIVAPCIGGPGEVRYLLVRWPDWPPPALLSVELAGKDDTIEAAVAATLQARMSVSCLDAPRVAAERIPVRMRQPRLGAEDLGWLRPVAVRVEGDPVPDPTLDAVVALTLDEALAALSTDVERRALSVAARLVGEG